jgi:hypothetical protein
LQVGPPFRPVAGNVHERQARELSAHKVRELLRSFSVAYRPATSPPMLVPAM